MKTQKKISAAIAAVMEYIQEEEAALMQQAAWGGITQTPITMPVMTVKPWGLNGRQTLMQMRNLMQLRTFR